VAIVAAAGSAGKGLARATGRARKTPAPQFTALELTQHIQNRTVPGEYLYERIGTPANEAHGRRKAARGIAEGAAPPIVAPAVVINPPV
jgi:hypothetical protein